MMLTALINWRRVEDRPADDDVVTAILAYEDEGRVVLEAAIHTWAAGAWMDEFSGNVNTSARWWVPESELVSVLGCALRFARRHGEARP